MNGPSRGIQEVVRRIRGEFLEMPGLRLTTEQARHRLVNARCTLVWLVEIWLAELKKNRD